MSQPVTALRAAMALHAMLWAGPALAGPLLSPLPVGSGEGEGNSFRCPPAPPPVLTLGGVSYYVDSRHSVADPALKAANEQMQQRVLAFVDAVTRMAAAWRGSRDAARGRCAAEWLGKWARADAFRDADNAAGGYRRSWYVAGLATVALTLRDAPGVSDATRLTVTRWLAGQGHRIVDFYAAPERARDALNNHGDWAALAVALAAIGAQDEALFDWADHRYRTNLAQITPEGALPLEIARGRRALHYHLFALTPLMLMARVEQVNTRPYDTDAMARLERFTRSALEHPSHIGQMAGAEQDMPGRHGDPSELGWAVVSADRPGVRLTALLAARSPVIDRRVGGNVRLTWLPSAPKYSRQ